MKKNLRILAVAAAFLPLLASTLALADGGEGEGQDPEDGQHFGFVPRGPVVVRSGPIVVGGQPHPGGPVFVGPPPGFPGPPGRPGFPPGPPWHPGFPPGPPVHPGFPPGPPGPRPPIVVRVPPPIPGHVYTPPPRDPNDDNELEVTRLLAGALRARTCDRAGDVLREMANLLLSSSKFAEQPVARPPVNVIVREGEGYEAARERWRAHLRDPRFMQIVWSRLAEMYRQCNKGCFDDGVAVGQISATGYCSASIAVGGLNAPGFLSQGALPLCQNETFTGCLVGYDQTSSTYQGCSTYATGGYTQIYNESKSQDCHISP